MEALMACSSCGFVTRGSGEIGAPARCPHCERQLQPAAACDRQPPARRQLELARLARAGLPPLAPAAGAGQGEPR